MIYNQFWFLFFKFITKLVIIYKFLFLGTIITSVATFGITIAGISNETTSTSQTTLSSPRDIIQFNNSTLFVADGSNHIFAFQPNNRTARTVKTFDNWVGQFRYDNKSSNFYAIVYYDHLVYICPLNATIPPDGIKQGIRSFSRLFNPLGVVIHSSGKV